MVVKVIKQATKFHEIICVNCACTLQFVNNDITSRTQQDYTGEGTCHYEIFCPACRYLNDVKERPYIKNEFNGRIVNGKAYLPGEEIPKDEK